MTTDNQFLDPLRLGEENEPKRLIKSFVEEQFNKLSLQGNLGLNSKIKRTFTRP